MVSEKPCFPTSFDLAAIFRGIFWQTVEFTENYLFEVIYLLLVCFIIKQQISCFLIATKN